MNRILLEPQEIAPDGSASLRDARADHVRSVLRAEVGREIRIGQIDGPTGTARIVTMSADEIRLECHFAAQPPVRPPIDLLLALPRPKVMKRLWAPLAALGVGRILLTRAAKVERTYFETHWIRPEHYRPLLIEGLQQAGDTLLPRVEIHTRFRPLVEDLIPREFAAEHKLVADPSGERRFRDITFMRGQRALLAIGPEGGWTPFELDLLARTGFTSVTVGARILRADTACIALLALLQDCVIA
jgi:RsmE family RNA methyltransferase